MSDRICISEHAHALYICGCIYKGGKEREIYACIHGKIHRYMRACMQVRSCVCLCMPVCYLLARVPLLPRALIQEPFLSQTHQATSHAPSEWREPLAAWVKNAPKMPWHAVTLVPALDTGIVVFTFSVTALLEWLLPSLHSYLSVEPWVLGENSFEPTIRSIWTNLLSQLRFGSAPMKTRGQEFSKQGYAGLPGLPGPHGSGRGHLQWPVSRVLSRLPMVPVHRLGYVYTPYMLKIKVDDGRCRCGRVWVCAFACG